MNALNAAGVQFTDYQVNGDHYTSLGTHPDNAVGTFEQSLVHLFANLGSQSGNPLVYDSTLANEHASCAAQFPLED